MTDSTGLRPDVPDELLSRFDEEIGEAIADALGEELGNSPRIVELTTAVMADVSPNLAEFQRQVREQVAAETRRETAERILLASDVALGYRCPACYGKPAVHRWKNTGRKRRYVCGCGHEWDALSRSAEWRAALDASPTALLRKVAKTGDLPEVPEKIARGES